MEFTKQDGGSLLLHEGFIRILMPQAYGTYVKVYLAGLAICGSKKDYTFLQIAQSLNILESDVLGAFSYWQEKNAVKISQNKIEYLDLTNLSPAEKANKAPHYTPNEIAAYIESDKNVRMIYKKSQHIFGKLLTGSDISRILSFYQWLDLPAEVVVMLLEYCVSKGKKGMAYIEKVAQDWSDRNINSIEKAEEYIHFIEERDSLFGRMQRLFGINGRNLTTKEQNYILDWSQNMGFSDEMIKQAHETAIDHTGKINFSYANKILSSWRDKGFQTLSQTREDKPPQKTVAQQKPAAKSKFNNFTQSPFDIEEIEKREREKIMNKIKKM